GVQTYRARYEAEAQGLLEAAKPGELAPLHNVFSTYFVTEAGKNAGMKLIDGALEAGDFAAAAWTAQRLLDVYPDLGADRPRSFSPDRRLPPPAPALPRRHRAAPEW